MVYTDNPCGEYVEDLWDLAPGALLTAQVSLDDFLSALSKVQNGVRTRLTPVYRTPLTKREREVLKACAFTNDPVAVTQRLQLGTGTLRNHLSNIYDKLELHGFADLSAYYFGVRQNAYSDQWRLLGVLLSALLLTVLVGAWLMARSVNRFPLSRSSLDVRRAIASRPKRGRPSFR